MKKNNVLGGGGSLEEFIEKLEKENCLLRDDNRQLAQKLDSKRYKTVDFLTDGFYALIRKKSVKARLIENNLTNKSIPINVKRTIKPGRIDIINMNFFDWDGKVVYKGGAERYVYDLACLLNKIGYKARILQCSNIPFRKKYQGIDVIGIGAGDKGNMRICSMVFSSYCNEAECVIASPLELASEIRNVPVIGINHGVNFDGEWNHYDKKAIHRYDEHMDALNNVVSCVCVDTNFINWTRTQDYELALKEKYIPNYYDAKKFISERKKRKDGKMVFVYPRRLYAARGSDITTRAFEKILPKYKDKVILNFVGQVDNDEARNDLDRIMSEFPENVFHYEYTMEEMPQAYKDADVVLVPTRYSEGTSLSCIEGMASGAAVIVTDVGGLPNLVIDGYNGVIISPTVDELAMAVEEMIRKPTWRTEIAANGLAVAKKAFTKTKWEESWKQEIKKVMATLNNR